jgi:hypothetical protein
MIVSVRCAKRRGSSFVQMPETTNPLMYTPGPFALCENIICYDGVSPNTKTQSYTQPELAYKF